MTDNTSDGILGSVLTYIAAWWAYVAQSVDQIDWYTAGAIVLLVARLVHDVPKAVVYLYGLYKKARDYVRRKSK